MLCHEKKKAIRFPTKIKLYKSLVMLIPVYGCDSWTLVANLESNFKPLETNRISTAIFFIVAGRQKILRSTAKCSESAMFVVMIHRYKNDMEKWLNFLLVNSVQTPCHVWYKADTDASK